MRVKTRGVVAALKAGLTAVAFVAASTVAPASATGQTRPPDQRPTVAVMPNFDNGSVLNHAYYVRQIAALPSRRKGGDGA